MKVLLLQPPIEDFYDTDVRLQPIGLGYLKAALLKFIPDINVKVLDLHRGHGRHTVTVPTELTYLREYYTHNDSSPFCTFDNYYRFGASVKKTIELLKNENPRIVGISSLFSPYYKQVLELAKLCKDLFNCTVVVGGSHASAVPESLLGSDAVDYVIVGEGEKPLVELVKAIKSQENVDQIAGLVWRKGNIIHKNLPRENFELNEIPYPDFSDLNMKNYLYRGRPMTFMITSRSCPHRCSFCSVHNTFGQRYRRRTVENVLGEIRLRYNEGYRVIDFEDDNLTFYTDEMAELCQRLIAEFPSGAIELVAMNGISYLSLDRELLKLMKRAGFARLNLSLVSSDQSVLRTTKRPHTVERYLTAVNTAFELGFHVTSYQILGLPFEGLDSQIQTLVFAAQQPVLLGASPFYLTPNSPIAHQMKIPPTLENIVKARLTAMANETKELSRDQLFTLFITTRIINFLKGLSIPADTRQQRGLFILNHLLKTNVLLADTPSGFRPIPRFNGDLFFRIWKQLEFVKTIGGQRLEIKDIFAVMTPPNVQTSLGTVLQETSVN